MSDLVLVAVIAAVPATIGAFVGMWNARKIEDVHVAVNSRLSELLALTAKAAHAEGKAEK